MHYSTRFFNNAKTGVGRCEGAAAAVTNDFVNFRDFTAKRKQRL